MDKSLKKLRVGIIGLGRISVRHVGSCKILDNLSELVAVCDVKKDVADNVALTTGAKAYYDYKEMLGNGKLDCVHGCLPHYLHTIVSEYAFSKGVNVLCEKPMAIDYASAKTAVENAKKYGVLYGIIFQCRYNDASVFVKNAVENGSLGKILSATSVLTWARPDDYYVNSDWKGTWDKEGGGVVIDQTIHSIDLVNWLVNDEVEAVNCSMHNFGHDTIKVEDTAQGLIKYKNGVKYGFYCMNNNVTDEPISIKLFCENGKAEFSYTDAKITYKDGTVKEVHENKDQFTPKNGKDYWGYKHIRQIEQFYKACLGLEPLDISGENALKTHKIITELYDIGKNTLKIK